MKDHHTDKYEAYVLIYVPTSEQLGKLMFDSNPIQPNINKMKLVDTAQDNLVKSTI
jgi:hypothetical protein